MTDTTYMKITALKEGVPVEKSKYVIVETTENWYTPKDPNNHGYYHIPHAGKVGLIQVFQAKETSKPRKTEHTDMGILGMGAPKNATCVLRTEMWGIRYAIHEVLSASEWVETMMQRSIERNSKK
jgi:hypothetical protein